MIGSIISGLIGKGGADAAAAGVRGATNRAVQAAETQKTINTSNYSPYTNLGLSATSKIGALLGFGRMYGEGGVGGQFRFDPANAAEDQKNALNDFYTSPGYNFRLQEGVNALDRSAAAKGRLISGAQTKAVQNYGQGLASDEYNNWVNQYWKALGVGQGATEGLTNANTGLTANTNNVLVGGARAAGDFTTQGANALASGIGNGINNLILGSYLGYKGGLFGGGQSGYGITRNSSTQTYS